MMTDMIKITDDVKQVIKVWQQAFGDSEEDILFFDENCKNKECLGYYKDGRLVSLLYLVDCVCDGENSKYIFAACTLKEMQGKGYMSCLLDYCKKNTGGFCLIPADDKLVKFYYDRGLTDKTEIYNISFNENEEIKEYLFEGCSLEQPFLMKYTGG